MFDGNNWTKYSSNGISNSIYCTAIGKDGNKWFGSRFGVYMFDGTTWKHYTTADGLVENTVYSILIDKKGNKWFGTNEGLSKFDGTSWITYKDSLSNPKVYALDIDSIGNIWIGTNDGITKFDGTHWSKYYTMDQQIKQGLQNIDQYTIKDIAIDKQGNKWFCIDATGLKSGIYKFDNSNWTKISKSPTAIAIDQSDNLWFAELTNALRFNGSQWASYPLNSIVMSVTIDFQGDKWFGTNGAIWKFNDSNWTKYDTNNGLNGAYFSSIALEPQGRVWCGTSGYGIWTASPASMTVSSTALNIDYSAGSIATFDITSNTSWTVNSNKSWLTVSSLSGSNNSKITLTTEANPTTVARTAAITVSDGGLEYATITVTQAGSNTTNVESISDSHLIIYPNPVRNKIIISFSNPVIQKSVQIYSLNGIEFSSFVNKNTINEIDMSKYAPGVYFLKIITSDNGVLIKKIIKQ